MSFPEFIQRYPRKKAVKDAEKAYGQVTKQGAKHEDIMAGLERMIEAGWEDIRFVPYPATWLRGWRWLDEPDEDEMPWKDMSHDERREYGQKLVNNVVRMK